MDATQSRGVPLYRTSSYVFKSTQHAADLFALKELGNIEILLGRVRGLKNGPRVIDLDMLLFGQETIDSADLVVPHPRIKEREFVLKGLRELGKA